MFKMAKGFSLWPKSTSITNGGRITRITPQSFVGTSFVYFGTPRVIVKKNNAVIDDFEIEEGMLIV
jgi:hypothetical protein